MKRNKNGFTLVELLAVIVILAIILVIAVPKVMSVIEDAKKATLESTAKMIASNAEKQKVQNTVLGNNKEITCDSVAKINDLDYEDCDIDFDDNTAKVTIKGSGKFAGLYVCSGTKTSSVAINENCDEKNNDDIQNVAPVLNCTFDGELVPGAEFIHNQYTYRYKQSYNFDHYEYEYGQIVDSWKNMKSDGWGVTVTDKSSSDPINTPICTYINGKPLLSTSYMLALSSAQAVYASSWNTSTVIDMSNMFYESSATSLDLSGFDTSNVTNMSNMFESSAATTLDLSSFDTSNVTYMSNMFYESSATSLDLSSFDTSNVTNMNNMFRNSAATTGYARTWIDAERFNDRIITKTPEELTFILKNNDDIQNVAPVLNCTFDGELVPGAEFIHNQYTYRYKQSYSFNHYEYEYGQIVDSWKNMESDGWGVTVTDKSSSDPINTPICTYINGKPLLSTSYMLALSSAQAVYASSWNTSTVIDMSNMFYESSAKSLHLANFDTSNVTNMSGMFRNSAAITLDLSSFDTSNVTNMSNMFYNSLATTGYARTQTDAERFNGSSNISDRLTFVVESNE